MAMMCRKPYVRDGLAHGCGQCGPCRYNRRRLWMHRIMLEAAQYEDNCYLTLTYDDEHLPEGGSLSVRDYQLFMKALRQRVAPSRFRFFLVGEYGDESFRPHYHAALFGFPTCVRGDTRIACKSAPCHWCKLVRETWGRGNVVLGRLEDDSAGYISGYVVKKMTAKDDPRLGGRVPEFGRMSLRPGIGYSALWEIADAVMRYELDAVEGDVPGALRHGSKVLPLGRYLRGRLREMCGHDSSSPESTKEKAREELRPLFERASYRKSLSSLVADAGAVKALQFEARQAIFKQRKTL